MARSASVLVSASLLVALVAGCGDNAEELAAARKTKKPAPAGTTLGGEQTPPTTVVGGGPTTTTTPTMNPTAGGVCQPRQVGAISGATWRPPNPLHRQVCTQAEATNIVNCYIGQSVAACDSQVTVPCHDCIVSDTADASYGAIIFNQARPQDVELNVEGCVAALSGDTSANGCGPRMKQAELCKLQACAGCQDQNALAQCAAQAAAGACAQYEAAARACSQQFLATCMPSNDRIQLAFSLAQAFCM